jgi:hypothetical protein
MEIEVNKDENTDWVVINLDGDIKKLTHEEAGYLFYSLETVLCGQHYTPRGIDVVAAECDSPGNRFAVASQLKRELMDEVAKVIEKIVRLSLSYSAPLPPGSHTHSLPESWPCK